MDKKNESGNIAWILSYDDVPQYKKCYSDTEEEVVKEANRLMNNLKYQVNNKVTKIYPNEDKWELHILNK